MMLEMLVIKNDQIISHRLKAHHLNVLAAKGDLLAVAGNCGLQNTPLGTWETALFNRIENISLEELYAELYDSKRLLQAWSFRGAPYIFPTQENVVFLNDLIPQYDEPWIYTGGIDPILTHLQISFKQLLTLVQNATTVLDNLIIKSKSALDMAIADQVSRKLPPEKQSLWQQPSMLGAQQTVGEAAVSFLLRPCSLQNLVVFGKRDGCSPTFTSFRKWTGIAPPLQSEGEYAALVKKYLHCYAPASAAMFADWLGCSWQQALRIWSTASADMVEVRVENKSLYILKEDMSEFLGVPAFDNQIKLLSPHDPYLGLRDREVILPDQTLQKQVWKSAVNPGAVLKNGRVIGIWKTKTAKANISVCVEIWEPYTQEDEQQILTWTKRWAQFKKLQLLLCDIHQLPT